MPTKEMQLAIQVQQVTTEPVMLVNLCQVWIVQKYSPSGNHI